MDDDFLKLFDKNDLRELAGKSQEIQRNARRAQIDASFSDGRAKFYAELGDHLADLGISADFDIANSRLIVTFMRHGRLDYIPLIAVDRWSRDKVSPEALAAAISAALLEPKFFRFWEDDEQED